MPVLERDRPSIVGGVLIALVGAGFLFDSLGLWRMNVIYIWPLVVIGIGVSVLLGRARRMEVEEKRSTQLVAAEERMRIARELHDIVAHSVSLMTVQIAAARRVFERQPEEAKRALESAEGTGRQSLTELRTMLEILRSADESIEAASLRGVAREDEAPTMAPLPGLKDFDGLVTGLRKAGLNATLEVAGTPPDAPSSIELAAYRVVQEAVTNVVRHVRDAKVKVRVEYHPDEIEIEIDDDGAGAAFQGRHVEGHGLLGMRERVAAVGGTLEAGPKSPGGWRVHARIPVKVG